MFDNIMSFYQYGELNIVIQNVIFLSEVMPFFCITVLQFEC